MDGEHDLDSLFEAARGDVAPPSERLMQAILRDAAEALPRPAAAPVARPGLARRFLRGIGGWQSLAALAVSACLGLWIGYSEQLGTALLDSSYSLTSDASSVDNTFYSDIDDLLMEG